MLGTVSPGLKLLHSGTAQHFTCATYFPSENTSVSYAPIVYSSFVIRTPLDGLLPALPVSRIYPIACGARPRARNLNIDPLLNKPFGRSWCPRRFANPRLARLR